LTGGLSLLILKGSRKAWKTETLSWNRLILARAV